MKNFKKVVAAGLALLMLALSVNVTFAAEEYTDKEAVVVAKVNAAGIMQGTDKGFEKDKTLTRAEAAAIMVRMKGISEDTVKQNGGTTLFTDVAASHWAAGYINVASNYAIIKGVGNDKFAPEDEVTVAQFYTMAVRALGATAVAEAEGTWPTNYVNFAIENKLAEDVAQIYTAKSTRMTAATIAANTLEANMWKKGAVKKGEVEWEEKDGVNIRESVLNIYEDTITVKEVSIKDNEVTDKNGKDWEVNEKFDLSTIKKGLKYTYWYDKDEDDEILGMWLDDTDSVSFTEITKVTTSKVTLMVDGKEKEYKFADSFAYTRNENEESLTAKNENAFGVAYLDEGKVTAIFATDFQKYEVIKEVKSNSITFENVEGDGADDSIVTNNTKNEYFLTKDGKGIEFSDLEKGDAIAYYTIGIKNGTKYVIEVISDTIEGKVTSVGTGFVKVDKVKYDSALSFTADDEITAWLNHAGDIVMYDVAESAESETVIVTKVTDDSYNTNGGMKYNLELALYYTNDSTDSKYVDVEETYKELKDAYDLVFEANNVKFYVKGTADDDDPEAAQLADLAVTGIAATDTVDNISSAKKKAIGYEFAIKYAKAGKVVCYKNNGDKIAIVPTDEVKPEVIDAKGTLSVKKSSAYITLDTAFDFDDKEDLAKVYVDENTTFFKLKEDGSKVKVSKVSFEDLDDDSSLAINSLMMGYSKSDETVKYVVFADGSTVKRTKETNFALVTSITGGKEDGKDITVIDVIYMDGSKGEDLIINDDTVFSGKINAEDDCEEVELNHVYDIAIDGDHITDVDTLNNYKDGEEEDELFAEEAIGAGKFDKFNSSRRILSYKNTATQQLVAENVLVLEYDRENDEYSVSNMDALRGFDYNANDNTIIIGTVSYIEDASEGKEVVVLIYELKDTEVDEPEFSKLTITANDTKGTDLEASIAGLEYSYNGGQYASLTKNTPVTIDNAEVGKVISVRYAATDYTQASDALEYTLKAADVKVVTP